MLADSVGFINMIKRVALAAVRASKPAEVCFGRVIGTEPLKIATEQKMPLGEEQLVLAQRVTEQEACISAEEIQASYYEGESPDAMKKGDSSRLRAVREMPVTIHNGLAVGDRVLLLRQQGGQKYIVLDRLG